MTRRAVVLAMAAAAAVAGASWCFDRVIVPERLAVIVLPCAVLPPALAVIFRNIVGARWTLVYVLTASLVGYVVIGLTAGVGLGDVAGFRSGLEGGLTRLFSTTLPIVDHPQALVGVASFIWLASSVTSWLAASSQRAGLSLLPPVVVAMVGLLAAVNGVGRTWVGPAAWVAGSVLLLGALAAQSRWPAPRLAVGQIAVVAAAVVLVVVASGGLPQRSDAVGVDQEEPPVFDRLLSPLDLARVLHQDDFADRTILSVRSDDPTDAIRIATMDAYNGSKWSVASSFRSTDRRVGVPTGPAASIAEVTIVELASAFVPAPSNPVEVDGVDGLRFAPGTATLRSDDGVSPGDTYTVRSSRAATVNESQLSVSVPASDDPARAALDEVDVDNQSSLAVLDTWIDHNAPTSLPPAYRLSAIATYLSNPTNRVDEKLPQPGASLSAVLGLATAGDGMLVATESQFATLFCVLADRAGFPCRLVVGFRDADGGVPAGVAEFVGRDTHVWPEVRLAAEGKSMGWVPFDVAPKGNSVTADVTTTTAGGTGPGVTDQVSIPDNPPTTSGPPPTAPVDADDGAASWWSVGIGILLAAAVAVSLVPLYRMRQAQRRLSGPATRRVIGAWLVVLDALDAVGESSHLMGSGLVVDRVTAVAGPEVGAMSDELRRIVVPVLYGGVEATGDEADRAVALARRCSESILVTGTSSQRRRGAFRRPRQRELV